MAKILIIEDDQAEAHLLQTTFAAQGFEAEVAANGEEGLTKAQTFHPDLISLDILLPGINGMEVLDKLKADTNTKNIPVVILSQLDGEKDIETALSKGAVQFMTKSEYTNPEKIVEVIKQVLANPQQ